ncbi:MAG: ABC transporter permease [Chlamydiales bacterium]
MWQRIMTLIRKELLGIWRDPKSRASLLVPPIIQLFIFTFAATLDVKNVAIAILNRDTGERSIELVQRFNGSPTFSKIHYLRAVEEIAPVIDQQKAVMVVSIDEQFSANIDKKKPARVQLILDGRKSNTAQIISGYATSILNQYNKELMQKNPQKVVLVARNWFNPNLLYYWYNIPSLVTTLSMLTCLVVTSISVARERELGTFDQLLVSPIQPIEIVIGKIVPGIIVGLLEATLLLSVGVFFFHVPFTGSALLIFVSLLIFITAISGVGLFISSLCTTQQQAMLGTFIFMVPSVLLSGFATPIENMPTWLQPVTYLIPMRYMLIISKGIFLKAMPTMVVFKNLWQMVIIAIGTQIAAGLFFRRKLE